MIYLSKYLKSIQDRPGMYIGPETPANLETFIAGFDAAHPIDYVTPILRNRGVGSKGISGYDSFERAFQVALEGAIEAEKLFDMS